MEKGLSDSSSCQFQTFADYFFYITMNEWMNDKQMMNRWMSMWTIRCSVDDTIIQSICICICTCIVLTFPVRDRTPLNWLAAHTLRIFWPRKASMT